MTVITYRGATVLEFDDKENSPLDKLFVVKLGTSPLELENPEDRAKILAAVKSTEKERKLNHLEKMREDKALFAKNVTVPLGHAVLRLHAAGQHRAWHDAGHHHVPLRSPGQDPEGGSRRPQGDVPRHAAAGPSSSGGGGLQLPPPVRLTPSVDSEEDWVDPAQLTSRISLRLLAEHAWCEDLRLSAEQAAARGRVTPRPASDVVSPGSPGGKKRERS